MAFTQINNLTIHYKVEGSTDNPALVFVNSLGTDWRIWEAVASHLNDRFFVIRYDQRGHGLSDCPPGPYTIEEMAEDLAGLLDYLSVSRAVPIGLSVGGMVSLAFAARYPERVPKLILSSTGAVIGTAAYWGERIAALERGGFDEMGDAILDRWFTLEFARARPAAYRGYGNMLRRMPLAGYLATCAAIRDADLSDAARSLEMPALVLCGAEDVATPPSLGQKLAEMLRSGRFHLIPQAAHLLCIEQPDKMAEAIEDFIG